MDLSHKQLKSLARVYDVLLSPDSWGSIMDELDEQMGGKGSNVIVVDLLHHELSDAYHSKSLLPVAQYYLENAFDQLERPILEKITEFIPQQNLTSSKEVYESYSRKYKDGADPSYFTEWMRERFGIHARYTSPLNYRRFYSDIATFHFGKISKSRLRKKIAYGNLLLPHIAKVIELSRPFKLLHLRFRAILDALDRFHLGVIILSSDGSLVVQNQAAEKINDHSDDLFLNHQNKLACRNQQANRDLQIAIKKIKRLNSAQENHHSAQLSIPRKQEKTPYLLEVSALRSADIEMSGGFNGVLVIVIDPENPPNINTNGLKELYNLTKAEQEVCKLVVEGLTTEEIAQARNTTIETVRSQIKSLTSKTYTKQRTELVKLALTVNPPVDPMPA